MAVRETHRDIDRAASEWAARQDRGPLSPDDAASLEAWLRGDPRRRGALLRARAVSLMSESAQALGPDFDPETFAEPRRARLSRRGVLTWSGAAVAAAVAGLPGITLRGLMAIPEPAEGDAAQRAPHRALHELLGALNAQGLALDTLSMGMSSDMEAAVAEGATLVRVGTAIFGSR